MTRVAAATAMDEVMPWTVVWPYSEMSGMLSLSVVCLHPGQATKQIIWREPSSSQPLGGKHVIPEAL